MKKQLLILGMLLSACSDTGSDVGITTPVSLEVTSESVDASIDDTNSQESVSTIQLEEKSMKEALNIIKSSPFSSPIKCDGIGFEDISDVGINEDRYLNEELYGVPEHGTVYNAKDYGIVPSSQDNAKLLNDLIVNIGGNEGVKIITFEEGVYEFNSEILIELKSDIYLVGQGKVKFNLLNWGSYFEAVKSKNIHINNIHFDMKYSPTVKGVITSVNEDDTTATIRINVEDSVDLSRAIYKMNNAFGCSYMEYYYDSSAKSYVPNRNGNLVYNSPTSANNKGILDVNYEDNDDTLVIKLNKKFTYSKYKTPAIGTVVNYAFTMYENHGFFFDSCENTYLENVVVNVTGGMGFRFDSGKNVYLNRLRVMPDEHRLMTSTADIIHSCAVEGDVKITNSTFVGSHDDALNIKSFYTKVYAVNASLKEIEVTQTQSEVVIKYEVGDTIEIFNPENMESMATYTIVDLTPRGNNYILTLDRRPLRNIEGYNVGNITKATKLELNNSYIGNKRNRGILLQARESKIVNCTFENVVMGAVQVLSVNDSFREAIMPANVEIKSCKFIRNYADIDVFTYGSNGAASTIPGTIKSINIHNNLIYEGRALAINLLGLGSSSVNNNVLFYESAAGTLIRVRKSSDLNIHSNSAIAPALTQFGIEADEESGLVENNNRVLEV